MPQITFDNFYEGLAPKYFQGPSSTRIGSEGMYAGGTCNPLSLFGYLSPANDTFTDYATGTATLGSNDSIVGPVLVDDGNLGGTSLYFGLATKVYGANLTTNTLVNTGEFPYTIDPTQGVHSAHLSVTFQDACLYQVNGKKRLLYFYMDDTDGDMGSYDLDSSFTADSNNDSVWSNAASKIGGSASVFDRVLTSGQAGGSNSRTIIAETSDNNFLYVANGSQMHIYDGTTDGGVLGTVHENVLDIGIHRTFVDMRDTRGNMWCAIEERASTGNTLNESERFAGVAIWDKNSSVISFNDFVPTPGVAKIHNLFLHEGIPHLFSSGHDDIVHLRKWNGNTFSLLKEVGVNNSQPATRRSVVSLDNGILWIGADGEVYFYGTPAIGFSEALYILGSTDATEGVGFVIKTHTTQLTTGYYDGTNRHLVRWGMNDAGSLVDLGDVYTLSKTLPKLSILKGMTVFFKGFTSTADANFSIDIYKNGGTSSLGTFNVNYNESASIGFKYFQLGGKTFSNINEFQLKFRWPAAYAVSSSVRISRIIIEYEYIGKKK